MDIPEEIPIPLRKNAISLDELEISEPAWPYFDALEVIKALEGTKMAITGGVLFLKESFGFVPTKENWCCDRIVKELAIEYAQRSRQVARHFVESFANDHRMPKMVFLFLFTGQQEAA